MKKLFFNFLFTYLLITLNFKCQQTIYETIIHDNLQRDYILYIPQSYNPSNPVPLLLCFHGFTSNAEVNFNYTNFKEIADTAGFILVHPQGSLLQGATHWNVGGWTTGSTTDDVSFTNTLIDTITSSYNINTERIYSTGMSNGGYMSFLLACQLSYRFAAVASVTGSMTPQTFNSCHPNHPTPILQIHGTADGVVPYDGNTFWTMSINEVLQYWSDYNNCLTSPTITEIPNVNAFDGSTAEHHIYIGGDRGTTVEHFKVFGGDHDWPGAFGNMDFNASAEVWKFFSKYDINGKIESSPNTILNNFKKHSILIYPNVVNEFINVELEFNSNEKYQIFSTDGKLVGEGIIESKKTTINVSTLYAGSYLFKVKNSVNKFIVSRN